MVESRLLLPSPLCDRYNKGLALLKEAVGREAARALFLTRIEKTARQVGNFEMVSHPVHALAKYVAGDRLQRLTSGINTARSEWRAGRHPREVVLQALTQHASPETQFKFVAAWSALEKWWNANAGPQKHPHKRRAPAQAAPARPGAPAPAPVTPHAPASARAPTPEADEQTRV